MNDLNKLIDLYGYWGSHPTYPQETWKQDIENDQTRDGYWEWVLYQINWESKND